VIAGEAVVTVGLAALRKTLAPNSVVFSLRSWPRRRRQAPGRSLRQHVQWLKLKNPDYTQKAVRGDLFERSNRRPWWRESSRIEPLSSHEIQAGPANDLGQLRRGPSAIQCLVQGLRPPERTGAG
jgi:hypothetical protein